MTEQMTEVVAKRSEASAGSESGIRVITGREENEMNRNGGPSRRAVKVTRARGCRLMILMTRLEASPGSRN